MRLGLLALLAVGCTSAAAPLDGSTSDGSTSDASLDAGEGACVAAGARCGLDVSSQCGIESRRDCILSAPSCASVQPCYMGPPPDGGAGAETLWCAAACSRCDVDCGARCEPPTECLQTATSCDAIAACVD